MGGVEVGGMDVVETGECNPWNVKSVGIGLCRSTHACTCLC
jgi:hypothetical protein